LLSFERGFNRICNEEGFDKSTWTIDLAYLLRRFNVKFHFYTLTIGIDIGYKTEGFYSNIIEKDYQRVISRFDTADKLDIKISKKSLDLYEILNHIAHQGPAIVLLNSDMLSCNICRSNKLARDLKSCLGWPISYQGHYVVICGFDLGHRNVIYRNPSYRDRLCVTSFAVFEQARKCYGTDEDIILIRSSKS